MTALHHELLLLGLLDERRMHGYELHEFLEHQLRFVSDLKKPTAYRLLERLYQRGLVERSVERQGRRPERLVYRLTPAGRVRFERLLREQLASANRAADPGNVALLFCDRLAPGERAALLRRRRSAVAELRDQAAAFRQAHAAGTPAWLVLEHELAHLEAELRWLDATLNELAGPEEQGAGGSEL